MLSVQLIDQLRNIIMAVRNFQQIMHKPNTVKFYSLYVNPITLTIISVHPSSHPSSYNWVAAAAASSSSQRGWAAVAYAPSSAANNSPKCRRAAEAHCAGCAGYGDYGDCGDRGSAAWASWASRQGSDWRRASAVAALCCRWASWAFACGSACAELREMGYVWVDEWRWAHLVGHPAGGLVHVGGWVLRVGLRLADLLLGHEWWVADLWGWGCLDIVHDLGDCLRIDTFEEVLDIKRRLILSNGLLLLLLSFLQILPLILRSNGTPIPIPLLLLLLLLHLPHHHLIGILRYTALDIPPLIIHLLPTPTTTTILLLMLTHAHHRRRRRHRGRRHQQRRRLPRRVPMVEWYVVVGDGWRHRCDLLDDLVAGLDRGDCEIL